MQYTFRYPAEASRLTGRRNDCIVINDGHLEQTHEELLNRLGNPDKGDELVVEIDAPLEHIWLLAAGSVSRFFSHQPGFLGLTQLNSLDSDEGGRYIIHRIIKGVVCNRIGEVLINMERFQLTLSDIDIIDSSVGGWLPML